jgi:hypothetical protein
VGHEGLSVITAAPGPSANDEAFARCYARLSAMSFSSVNQNETGRLRGGRGAKLKASPPRLLLTTLVKASSRTLTVRYFFFEAR